MLVLGVANLDKIGEILHRQDKESTFSLEERYGKSLEMEEVQIYKKQ